MVEENQVETSETVLTPKQGVILKQYFTLGTKIRMRTSLRDLDDAWLVILITSPFHSLVWPLEILGGF